MASLVTTTVNGTLTGNSSATFDSTIRSKTQLRVSADYSVNYFYKTDNTTLLGYLLMRDDNNSYLSFPAAQDFRILHGNTNRIAVNTNGSVGIGIISPAYPLDVKTAIQGAMQVKGAQTHGLLLGEAAYSTSALYTGLKTSYMTGTQDYMIISGTTTDGNTYISAKSGGNAHMRAGGNNQTNEIVVSASTGITYKSDVRHEFSTGDVGIGTASPAALLHVGGAAASPHAAADDFVIAPAATDVGMTIRCNSNAGTGSIFFADTAANAQGLIRYNHNTDYMSFSSSGDYFFDTTNGSVGIGTNDPGQLLHVQGATSIVHVQSSTANANASIWFNSNVSGTQANRWEIGTNISRGASLEIFDRLNSVSRLELTNTGDLLLGGDVSLTKTVDSGTGALIQLKHFRSSGATGFGDDLGTIDHIFKDSAGNQDVGVRMVASMGGSSGDNTHGEESTKFKIQTLKDSGTLTDSLVLDDQGVTLSGLTTLTTNGSGYALKIFENSGGEYFQLGINQYGGLNFFNETVNAAEFYDTGEFVMHKNATVSGSGHDNATLTISNAISSNARLLLNSGHGNWSVCNSDTVGDALEFRDESAGATRALIDSSGNFGIGTTSADAKLTISGNSDNGDDDCALRIIDQDTDSGSKLPAIMFYGGTTMQGRIRGGDGTFAIAVGSSPTTALAIDTSTKATTLSGTLTVGANDTGYDVRLYGATSGRYWEWDASMDLVRMRDNVKAVFGNGDDLEIYHDGSNSYVQDTGTGDLILKGDNVRIKTNTSNDDVLRSYADGAVELYYNDAKKFETLNTGAKVTGTLQADILNNAANSANIIYRSGSSTIVGNNASALVVLDTGFVGIGMSPSSTYRLAVTGTNNTPVQILSTANSCNLTLGNSTQTQYTNILFNSNSGNAQIWKAGGSYSGYGGANSLNIYCSNGKIAFHPNAAANKVVIDTNGYVGIGTASPNDDLNIHDSSASANLGIKITRGTQTHGLRIGVNDSHAFVWTDQSQNLAFATNNTERLTIASNGVTSLTTAGNTQVNNYYASLIINNTGSSTWSRLRFDRSGVEKWGIGLGTDDKLRISNLFTGGTAASPNDSCFVIDNNGQVGINTDPDGGLKIKSRADGENVLNIVDSAGDAMFNVRQSSNDCLVRGYKDAGAQKWQIHSDGDSFFMGGSIGIGTETPGAPLHIYSNGSANTPEEILCLGSNTSNIPVLQFSESVNAGFNTGMSIQYRGDYGSGGDNALGIHSIGSSASTAGDAVATFKSGGKVGIGTTDPASILHLYSASASNTILKIQGGGDTDKGAYINLLRGNTDVGSFGTKASIIGGTSDNLVVYSPSNAIELYYGGSKKFETTSAGVTITGTATATTFSGSGASLTSLNATQLTSGTVPAARLGNVTIASSATDILSASSGSISADDAGADKIVFWDESASKLKYLTVGSNLSISGTTISASGGGGGSGTVTSVATSTGLQGGTITTSGTLSVVDSVCMGINKNSSSTAVIPSNRFFDFGEGTGISLAFSAGGYTNKITFSTGTSSDYRLKKNISTFNSDAWTKVKSVNLRKFDFDEDAVKVAIGSPDDEIDREPQDGYTDNLGFIAHELAEAGIKGAVIGDKDGVDGDGNFIYQKVNYISLVPVLWGALNEAISKIETLESKVQALEDK